ncbi:hypothetical protein Trydic_g4106 [Trypoxylus dichotomus]
MANLDVNDQYARVFLLDSLVPTSFFDSSSNGLFKPYSQLLSQYPFVKRPPISSYLNYGSNYLPLTNSPTYSYERELRPDEMEPKSFDLLHSRQYAVRYPP